MAYNIITSGTTANLINLEELKASVNGNLHKLAYINSNALKSNITLPTAPNIYPYDATLTTEQINRDVIKHADASNSGLVLMGKNLSGTTFNQTVSVVNGKKYIIEYKDNTVRKTLEITASSTSYIISLSGTNITEVGMYPVDAISRSDLVFLESWHEDVSEKNFVYPLGNVQYLGGNVDGLTGIANGVFTGVETYSLKGNWQTPSALIGKGYVWSSLTEAQKKAFIANPENNCYLDGDKVIQVRYRVRVVQGLGDNWYTVNTQGISHMCYAEVSSNFVAAKGKSVSLPSDFRVANTNVFAPSSTYPNSLIKENGIFEMRTVENVSSFAYEGKCYALPIAFASRRNQGMYHPVYNPNGTKKASDGNFWYNTAVSFTSISDCFDPAKLLTASGYIGTVSGRPDGLFYDQVHESDMLDLRNSSKKVEDYNRLISREFNKLVEATYRGKEGEWEVLTKTDITLTYGNYLGNVNTNNYLLQPQTLFPTLPLNTSIIGKFIMVIRSGTYIGKIITSEGIFIDNTYLQIKPYPSPVRFTDGTVVPILTGILVDIIFAKQSTRTKSNTLLRCDIIGNPTNYPISWKQSGVSGTPLIVAEDGTSLLPDGVLDTFKLSRKANATPLLCLRSIDSGATWTSFTPTFNTTSNVITLTNEPATNLVMVYYQTHTSMAVPTVNGEVLEIGDIYASCHNSKLIGNDLCQTLISKISVNTGDVTFVSSIKVPNTLISNSGKTLFATSNTYNDIHSMISLQAGAPVAVKVFPYLTILNGKAYLNLVFKEMKYGSYLAPTVVTAGSATYTQNMTYKINLAGCALDGKVIKWIGTTATSAIDWSLYDVSPTGVIYLLSTGVVYTNAKLYDGDSWGDSNKFEIVDNVSTTIDNNGKTVLIGQKTVELNVFVGASE